MLLVSKVNLRVVTATREPTDRFWTHTALGRSLTLLARPFRAPTRLFGENSAGLPTVYNVALREAVTFPAILVFVHDDVEIIDHFWEEHIAQGLRQFDLIGLAGNTRRVPNQCGWAFVDEGGERDDPYLSGTIGHESQYGRYPNVFGPSHREVKLLDGVMLACKSETLVTNGIQFDEAFDFHFYDLDMCRQFEAKGLRMGTWGVSMVHSSRGRYGSPEWLANRERYFAKWGS
jgi:hypothetical protein